jgi:hypothetical protein
VATGGGEQGGEVCCGGGTHAGQQVLVGGHGEAGVGVAEAFGHDFDRFAGSDEQ